MFHAALKNRRVVIGTLASDEAAGQAIDQLILSGFPVAQVFLFLVMVEGSGQDIDRAQRLLKQIRV